MDPHVTLFIQDLAIIMLVASVITYIFRRIKQPVVLGYIIAGMIVGPSTPPFSFIYDESAIKILAELGVIFLLFSLGLEFDLKQLKKVGFTAFVTAIAELVFMSLVGYGLGRLFGWSQINSIFLGGVLSISSTTIILKALEGLKLKRTEFARIIFGVLVIEDIFAIGILVLLAGFATTGDVPLKELLKIVFQLSIFIVGTLTLGVFLVPRLLKYVAQFESEEMLLITVLALCFGFSLIVLKLKYSAALGAFLIGVIIAESKQLELIERIIKPLRIMFSAIFFVSVGLLFNPKYFYNYFIPILVITIAVVFGKIISCSAATFATGHSMRTSLRVGSGMAQIGEFSFIIAALGISLKVTSDFLYQITVAVSVITAFLTPYFIKYSEHFGETIDRSLPHALVKKLNSYTEKVNAYFSRKKPDKN